MKNNEDKKTWLDWLRDTLLFILVTLMVCVWWFVTSLVVQLFFIQNVVKLDNTILYSVIAGVVTAIILTVLSKFKKRHIWER